MINIFITAIFAVISYQTFTLSTNLNALNKAILDIPISYFEISVKLINSITGHIYFDQRKLMDHLDEYFLVEVGHIVNDYEVNYEFYYTSDKSICLNNQCDGVRVNLKARVIFNYNFDKTTYYEITEAR